MINFLKDYELRKKYELKFPARKMLSPIGVEILRYWLSVNFSVGLSYTDIESIIGTDENLPKLTAKDAWGDDQNIGGRLTNRVQRWLMIRYQMNMTDLSKKELGDKLASYWIGGEEKAYIDFTDNINWQSGDFGEKPTEYGSSCWWHGPAVDTFNSYMADKQAFAVRLFFKDRRNTDAFVGAGRCWALVTRSSYPIIFNGYGWQIERWANRLALFFGQPQATVVPLFMEPSVMFVNNNEGYFIGPKDAVKKTYKFNLIDYLPSRHRDAYGSYISDPDDDDDDYDFDDYDHDEAQDESGVF